MLQSRLIDPFCGSDALLIFACKLFQDRIASFAAIVCRLDQAEKDKASDADRDDLQHRADGLQTEWQAIAQAVATTRAAHLAGRRAKADALHAYYQHVGGTEGIEIDLAQSLVADLRTTRGE